MSFFFFTLYLICTYLRPQEWVQGLYGLKLIDILSVIILVFLFFETFIQNKNKNNLVSVYIKCILGFYFSILMSHASHFYLWGVKHSFFSFIPMFVLFLMTIFALNSKKKLKISIWLIIVLHVFLVFQGIYQVKNGYGWAGQPILGNEQEFRITWIGIFNDPNDLALSFVVAVGFLIPFIFSKINIFLKLINLTLMTYLFYGVSLTNSRGGTLALVATVFFFFIIKTRKIIVGSILGGSLASLILFFGSSRMGVINSAEESAANRLDMWYEGLQMFKYNPLFGVGFNSFGDYMPLTAHNTYVLIVAELGFVGLFFWMAFIYFSFKDLNKIRSTNLNYANYAMGIQSALAGYCTASFFLSRAYIVVPYMLFAFAGALVLLNKNEIQIEGFNFKNLKRIFFYTCGIILLTYIAIKVG